MAKATEYRVVLKNESGRAVETHETRDFDAADEKSAALAAKYGWSRVLFLARPVGTKSDTWGCLGPC